ncbi:MAG: HYR domain-containing protein, partial [Saprospiraceae bacterium]|nr:HYR domain-containing protein [Saprospiraceae bacterium]
ALEIQGGTAGYQVNWSNGATGDVIENLPTGSYTANVTDANGCSSEITTGIEAKDEIAPVIVLNNATIALGMDGTVTLTPEAIDDGTYDNCSEVQLSLDKTVFTCDDLGTAAVEVTAVDESGNQNTGTADITIVDKLAPTVTCPEDMVLTNCPGIVVFDVPEYEDNCTVVSVELINGPESGSAFPLGTTSITFRGTDQSGNFTDCTFEIELINSLETEVEFENISCYGFNDGSIALEVSGGNPGYSYLWDDTNQSITPEITNLAPGSYSCVITDAEGCSRIEYFTIEEPELLIADVDQLIQPTVDQDNGSITVSVSGGTGVYTYEWTKQGDPDFYSTERDLENIGAGVYRLLVTDENGCSVLVEIRVESTVSVKNQHFSKDFSIFPNPSDGRVQILSTGNTGDYEYIISDVAGKQVQNGKISLLSGQSAALDLSSLSEGMYTVRLTNDLEVAILPIQIQKID